jgi:hypothetical protein
MGVPSRSITTRNCWSCPDDPTGCRRGKCHQGSHRVGVFPGVLPGFRSAALALLTDVAARNAKPRACRWRQDRRAALDGRRRRSRLCLRYRKPGPGHNHIGFHCGAASAAEVRWLRIWSWCVRCLRRQQSLSLGGRFCRQRAGTRQLSHADRRVRPDGCRHALSPPDGCRHAVCRSSLVPLLHWSRCCGVGPTQ